MFSKLIRENPKIMAFSSFQISYSLAISMVIPFFSIILLDANWTAKEITYFFAFFTLGSFLFSPIIGKISDEIGRKKIIMIGLIFEAIFFLSYYFLTQNQTLIYFIRFLNGIGSACVVVVALSAFEDYIKKDRGFWTGVFLSLGTVGALIGPIVAGIIANWYYSKILLFAGIFFSIFSIFLLTFLPEKKKLKKNKIKLKDFNLFLEIGEYFKYRELRGMALLGILMNSKGQIYIIFFPILVIEKLGLNELSLGILLAIPVFFHIFQVYFGKIADKVSAEFGIMFGVLLVAGSFLFIPYANSFSLLFILLLVYGIGGSIWNVNAWSLMGRIAKEKDIEGEVIGSYSSISKLGMFIATLISASLVGIFGIAGTLQLFAIVIIIGNVFAYFFFEPIFHHKRNKSYFHEVVSVKDD